MDNINDMEVTIYMRDSAIERTVAVFTQKSLVWIKIDNCGLFFISPYDIMRMYDKYGVDVACEYIIHSLNDKHAYIKIDHLNLCKIANHVLTMSQRIVYEQS